ncbi:hypothetical protein ACFLQR_02230 [Verrucomicrobiota bacterium]
MRKTTRFSLLLLVCVVLAAGISVMLAQEPVSETQGETPAHTSGADQAESVAAQPPPAPAPGPAASKNGNNGVFELLSSGEQRTADEGEVEDAAGARTDLISISFDEVPVPDVVDMFSRISGANIIVAGTFTNQFVTANLKNVEWKSALNLVLGSVGLSMIEDQSGIIMVVTSEMYQEKLKQIEETKPLVTRVFKPQYMNAVDLVAQVKLMNILSPRGTIITSQSKEQSLASLKSSESTTRPFSSTELRQNPSISTAVVVTDIKEYVEKIAKLIKKLDKREPQVFIEARIIDIISSDSSKLGFDWEMLDSFGISAGLSDLQWSWSDTHDVGSSKDNQDRMWENRSATDEINKRYDIDGDQYEETTTTYEESPPDSGNWISTTLVTPTRTIQDNIDSGRDITSTYGDTVADTLSEAKTATAILNVSEVSLLLSALQTRGDVKMLSHPLLIVGNRVEAKIHVGEVTWQISLISDVTDTGASPTTKYSEQAKEIQLGLKLWVIPEIDLASDMVRLTVNPEMTIFVEDIVTAQGSVYPVTSTRTITTRVNVPSGRTLVIGGLIDHSKGKQVKSVPFLSDIPLLGLLFRHTTDIVEKHNLVILLTPTILDDQAPATGYEDMALQSAEDLEMVPLGPKQAVAVPAALSGTEGKETNGVAEEASSEETKESEDQETPTPIAEAPAESSEPPADNKK